MKLSKQERIAAVVVVILVILVAGVFIFIKPNIETITATKATLESKEKEYNEAVNRVATKDGLKTQILEAYNKGKNLADMFYPELSAYEADDLLREFLASCKANVLVDSISSVSAPTTANLNTSIYVPAEVQYALKEYVNQGGSDVITDPRLLRQAMIQSALGEAQTIGATTISFSVKSTTYEDLLLFADEVNRYQKTENGKSIRKAIELNTIDFQDEQTIDRYEAQAESILLHAEAAAAKIFKDRTGMTLGGIKETEISGEVPDFTGEGEEGNAGAGTGSGNGNVEFEADIEHYYYEMPCTITFYSIVRMEDPTAVLNEQDAAV